MKKTLIALAALAATGAFAQNVTIGGNFDQTVYSQNSGAALSNGWIHNGNSTSLWNMTGSEDLGGGMKASFNLVSELNLMKGQIGATSTGASVGTTNGGQFADIFNRGANVALSGDFGTVTIGRQTDLWFSTQGSLNTSASNSYGFGNLTSYVSNAAAVYKVQGMSAANAALALPNYLGASTLVGGVDNGGRTGTAGDVFAGGVGYNTPVMSGFQAGFQSLTSDYANGGAGTGIAYNVTYNNGPLKLAAATTSKNDAAGASNGWVNTVYGGSYNLGAHTFILAVNKTSFSGVAATLDNMTTTGLGWNMVVTPKFDFNVSYSTLADDTNSANKATQIGLTGRYKLSARTSLYAGLGNVKNEGGSYVGSIYGGGGNTTADQNSTISSYMMGLKHTF